MIFRKLKRVWSNNNVKYIPRFKEVFPELNKVSSEEMCDRWNELGIDFYTEEKKEINFWVRITLPFALILMFLMFISLPINFIITSKWGYNLENLEIYDWLKSLFLID